MSAIAGMLFPLVLFASSPQDAKADVPPAQGSREAIRRALRIVVNVESPETRAAILLGIAEARIRVGDDAGLFWKRRSRSLKRWGSIMCSKRKSTLDLGIDLRSRANRETKRPRGGSFEGNSRLS